MSETNKKRRRIQLPIWVIILPLIDFVLVIRNIIRGKNVAILNPKGYIASQQHGLIVFAVVVLLTIAIPSLFLGYFIAWRYRDTNAKAMHNPKAHKSKSLDLFMWGVPTTFMIILSTVMWSSTHKLFPQKVIAASAKPLTIQVISLRWKWLFLYPDQKIATINYVQLPLNRPVTFEMTADETPMSSFWIPNLGGQLYTMTSHVNRLNLMATEPGDYNGSSAEINGAGFAGMKFTARASTDTEFNNWVHDVKEMPQALNQATYQNLVAPSQNNSASFFSSFDSSLYSQVIAKYDGHGEHSHN